jgi:cbb3-type cytochrome oxidase maturation protein
VEVIFIVLPLAILMAAVALAAFFWAVHRGQFDDLDTPRYRVLFEEPPSNRTSHGENRAFSSKR